MFVQIIEGKAKDPEAILERGKEWQETLKPGAEGYLGVTAGSTADGRTFSMVRFDSEADARANSDRPEQGEWWAETAKLFDGEPTFTESSDITLWKGGGSDDAGFVQVMKMNGVDRAEVEALDAIFEKYADARPDVLGLTRAWTGEDSCIDVVYFTSEADARKGEKAEMPAELSEALEKAMSGGAQVEFLDLQNIQLA